MSTLNRRFDLDWVRVIAIGLLLIYHVAIGFQPWGVMIGFIANKKSWESLWIPMTMLNVWRIPLLFFVSGMGVYFALQNRTWKQLLRERARRILVPFIVGIFLIVPIHTYFWQYHYNLKLSYSPNPGHVWFLGNIFAYVILLSPIFYYLKRNEDGLVVNGIKKVLNTPFGLVPVIGVFVAEALLVNPRPFELYAMTWHGFFLGLIAFFFGFSFVLSGHKFWEMILKWRWLFFAMGFALFIFRLTQFQFFAPVYLLAIESVCWIISVFAFSYKHLNHGSKILDYLSQAAYPVYIVHMIFLYLSSLLIFPLDIPVVVQFLLVLLLTVVGCFVCFEMIRRTDAIRPFFGLKMKCKITMPRLSLRKSRDVQAEQ
jgi:glucans biosynthesis protein C